LEVNGCGGEAAAIDPSPCVAYDECDSGQPVVWCEHPGDHALASSFLAPMSAFFEGLQ
jgi:hypothetical protein